MTTISRKWWPGRRLCIVSACLVIVEINRGKMSAVFGEALQLLEYREREVVTAAGFKFRIPEKFFLVGTMNSEDRSLFPMDRALMERFNFYDVMDAAVGTDPWSKALKEDGGKWPDWSVDWSVPARTRGAASAAEISEWKRRAKRASILIERALRLHYDTHLESKLKGFLEALSETNYHLVSKALDGRKDIEIGHARFLSVLKRWRESGGEPAKLAAMFLEHAERVVRTRLGPILNAFFPLEADSGRVAALSKLVKTYKTEGAASDDSNEEEQSTVEQGDPFGLPNVGGQGCFANALVQLLYNVPELREAVADLTGSVPPLTGALPRSVSCAVEL